MKILYVTTAFPYPPDSGGKIRSLHFLKYLATKGQVTMVSPFNAATEGAYLDVLKPYCEEIVTIEEGTFWFSRSHAQPPTWRARLAGLVRMESWNMRDFISEALHQRLLAMRPEDFDLIVVRYPLMAYYLLKDPAFNQALGKTIIDVDDVTVRMLERILRLMPLGYERIRRTVDLRFLTRYYRRMHNVLACVAASEIDRSYLLERGFAARVFVAPNTIDVNHAGTPRDGRASQPTLLFVGRLSYPPNEDGVVFFCERIFPRIRQEEPTARFLIVGQRPTLRVLRLGRIPGVEVIGAVPSTEPFYRDATVAVAPLLHGSGTRIKILEAMALKTPVVSTSIGCEGLEVADGEHLLIADDPEAFAQCCLALLRDERRRATLAENAYGLAKGKYGVAAFRRQLDACLWALGTVR